MIYKAKHFFGIFFLRSLKVKFDKLEALKKKYKKKNKSQFQKLI